METKFTTEQVRLIISFLLKTMIPNCTISIAIKEVFVGSDFDEDDLSSDELEHIYSEVFLCEQCGSWLVIDCESQGLQGLCKDCSI